MLVEAVAGLVLAVLPAESHTGYQPSTYQGEWFARKWEPVRKCIMKRESRFNYRAKNPTSTARGAYQFLDSKWRISLTWMMLEEADTRAERKEIKELRTRSIHTWGRYWQDRAFYTVWAHGEGRAHWKTTVIGTRNCHSSKG